MLLSLCLTSRDVSQHPLLVCDGSLWTNICWLRFSNCALGIEKYLSVSLFCLNFHRATQLSSVYWHSGFFDDNLKSSSTKAFHPPCIFLCILNTVKRQGSHAYTTKHTAPIVRKNRSFSLTDHSVV